MPGRGVADSLTSMGTSFPSDSTTMSTSVPARVRQKNTWGVSPRWVEDFHDLGKHRRLHDGASQGAGGGMCGISQARQMAQRPHVGEIDLGGLDESLPDIREVRAEHDHLICRFEHGQPGLDRVDRDANVPRDVREVQELSRSGPPGLSGKLWNPVRSPTCRRVRTSRSR